MATAALKTSGTTDTRQRIIEVAVRLFTRHSFAGTSLQMIADEMGFTKAAVYHHFRTREELLAAVVEPVFAQLRAVIEQAEALRGRNARADQMLTGYAGITVRHRGLISVLAGDPGVIDMLQDQSDLGDLIARQIKLLADVNPGPGGQVRAAVLLAGFAGAALPSRQLNLDDDNLRQHLIETGRRTLGLRAPRAG